MQENTEIEREGIWDVCPRCGGSRKHPRNMRLIFPNPTNYFSGEPAPCTALFHALKSYTDES